jgi:hypothetical protein
MCCTATVVLQCSVPQLQNSKDVVAQAQAVAGLAAQLGAGSDPSSSSSSSTRSREQARVDDYIITILSGVMRDDSYFCRCVDTGNTIRGCWGV